MQTADYISLLENVYVHALNDVFSTEEKWPSLFQKNMGHHVRGQLNHEVKITTISPIVVDASWLAKESTFSILYQYNNQKILAFRGTLHLSEWMKDLTLSKKEVKIGEHTIKVHSGFLSVFRAWHERNLHTLQEWVKDGKKITVIGHSLGGACAALFCFYYPQLVENVILFGTPKWADQPLNKYHSFDIENYCHPLDPVPSLPPTSSFVAVDKPILLKRGEKLRSESWIDRINAHFLKNYRSAISVSG